MVDLSGIDNYLKVIADLDTEAEIYGITATTPQMPACVKIVEVLRQRPNVKIILGGPHVTLVYAALRNERKRGVEGRAMRAYFRLADIFDTLVVGDGEDAIFTAIGLDSPKLVDADDPKGGLFLTNQRLGELPLPARHLVDLDSYHYTIDGVRATSMIAQLGCLVAGTMIRLTGNKEVAIEDVSLGDEVVCWDENEGVLTSSTVAAKWNRTATDIFELTLTSRDTVLVTSEHPVLTDNGWKQVVDLNENDKIAYLPEMPKKTPQREIKVLQRPMQTQSCCKGMSDLQKEIRVNSNICPESELLLSRVSCDVAKPEREREVGEVWASRHEEKMARHDSGRKTKEFKYKNPLGSSDDSEGSQDIFRNEDGRQESDEKSRGRRESLKDDKGQMGSVLFGSDEKTVERRKNKDNGGKRGNVSEAEWERGSVASNTGPERSVFSVRWKRCFLDWSLLIWQAAKSRFLGQVVTESYFAARRILAFSGIGGHRNKGLPGEELASAGDEKDSGIRFSSLISKKTIGQGIVYNITVCPFHSYIANNVVVHNCPFACAFCGGRFSPMLRRIRTRSTENIVAEMRYLYETYGFKGCMLYDDELNVNKQVVELMNAIADLGEELGIEWKLRGFIKSELFTDEQASSMYRAGFRILLVGFESGSPRILENINKKATREDNTRCLRIAHKHGLKVKALMSLGHAGESIFTVHETQKWLMEEKPDDFDLTVITTYPGTPYYDQANETESGVWTYVAPNGDRLHAYDMDFNESAGYYKGIPGEYQSFVFTDYLTAKEIVSVRDKVESEVRAFLGIPFNSGQPGKRYEASMGQMPSFIVRRSNGEPARAETT